MNNHNLFSSLSFRVAATVLSVEVIVLAGAGVLYVESFARSALATAEQHAELPTSLMNAGLLRLDAVSDIPTMHRLLDTDLVTGFVFGLNGNIFYASSPELVGRHVDALVDDSVIGPFLLSSEPTIFHTPETIRSVAPVFGTDGKTPHFYVYIELSKAGFRAERRRLIYTFAVGSFIALLVSSTAIILMLNRSIISKINKVVEILDQVRIGNLDVEVTNGTSVREIRVLQHGLNAMIAQRRVNEEDLRTSRDTAQEANRAKSLFLDNVNHELRTPLNGILGMASLLDRTGLNGDQRRYLSSIRESSNALLGVIQEILEISYLDTNAPPYLDDQFDVKSVLEEVVEAAREFANEKGLRLHVEIGTDVPPVRTDRTRVVQILRRILNNAVKYTDEGSVTLRARRVESALQLEVSDTGVGIPEGRQTAIFERFVQVEDPYTKTRRGIGLGLAITKSIVDQLGGEIAVASREGEGATFTVTLPCRFEDLPTRERPTAAAADYPDLPTRVLVVEDDAINRMYLRSLLQSSGYTVDEAGDGELAFAKVLADDYGLVLMDVGLPHMNGIDTARRIRCEADESHGNVPIVALTAHTLAEDKERCFGAGMNAFLAKPINERELLNVVGSFVHVDVE